jgi:hypothetical protein
VPRLGHDRLNDPPVSISRHLQQAADLLRRALVAEELLLALPDGRVLECESARAAEGGVQGGGEEARHGKCWQATDAAALTAPRNLPVCVPNRSATLASLSLLRSVADTRSPQGPSQRERIA